MTATLSIWVWKKSNTEKERERKTLTVRLNFLKLTIHHVAHISWHNTKITGRFFYLCVYRDSRSLNSEKINKLKRHIDIQSVTHTSIYMYMCVCVCLYVCRWRKLNAVINYVRLTCVFTSQCTILLILMSINNVLSIASMTCHYLQSIVKDTVILIRKISVLQITMFILFSAL